MNWTMIKAIPALLLTLFAADASLADSTNAAPVITLTETPFDPATMPWVSAEAKTYITDLNARFTKGEVTAYVVAAAPNGNWGVRSNTPTGYIDPSLSDMARQALEQCEYFYLMPCYLIAANGKSLRDASGSYADQPQMLSPDPTRFDYARIPFVPEVDRKTLRDYYYATPPKALMLYDSGYWAWKTGTTLIDAMTQAIDTCKTGNGGTDCYLYAVNNYVVMDFTR